MDDWVRKLQRICLFAIASAIALTTSAWSQDSSTAESVYAVETDILFRSKGELTDYQRERCRLDIYYPKNQKTFATIIWFHGGGLTSGNKSIPEALKKQGVAVIAANYRLSPKAKAPEYIEDAAAAVAWAVEHIESYGGSKQQIFVSGHSAGGYLASMIVLDKRWLASYDIDSDSLAGLIPLSGQAITHFTIRNERGIDRKQPVIDEYAPLFHVRKGAPPTLVVSGDRNLEMIGRYEENAYFWRMMKEAGDDSIELLELQGYNHGDMAEPAFPLLLRFVRKHARK